MNKIDQVAVALYMHDFNIPKDATFAMEQGGGLSVYQEKAKVAIKAMREPTIRMIEAAGYNIDITDSYSITNWMDAHDWPLMVDAALEKE